MSGSNSSPKSCRNKENHIKIKTISPSNLLYHFSARCSLSDKHLYLHNNMKDFTNATLSSYSSYQSSSRGHSYKGHIFTLKPKETLKFLDLSNKSISNIMQSRAMMALQPAWPAARQAGPGRRRPRWLGRHCCRCRRYCGISFIASLRQAFGASAPKARRSAFVY